MYICIYMYIYINMRGLYVWFCAAALLYGQLASANSAASPRPPLAGAFPPSPIIASPVGKTLLPPMAAPPRAPPLPDVKGMRCLIVDDEVSNRRLCARMLQRLEVKSLVLTDGDEVRVLGPRVLGWRIHMSPWCQLQSGRVLHVVAPSCPTSPWTDTGGAAC